MGIPKDKHASLAVGATGDITVEQLLRRAMAIALRGIKMEKAMPFNMRTMSFRFFTNLLQVRISHVHVILSSILS